MWVNSKKRRAPNDEQSKLKGKTAVAACAGWQKEPDREKKYGKNEWRLKAESRVRVKEERVSKKWGK